MRLHFEDTGGGGLPVVLLHGFPFSSAMWEPQLASLARAGYRAIAPDLRGHGRTPAGDGLFTIEQFADDVLGLMESLNLGPVVLCGLSMGGYVALRAAEKAPQKLKALVLADSRAEADANQAKLLRAAAMKAVAEKGVDAFAEEFVKNLYSPSTLAAGSPCVAKILKIMKANPALGVRGTLLALAARPDASEFLPKVKVPTLVIVGEEDKITPPALSESMAKAIPGAKLARVAAAGHLSSLERPEAFDEALLPFLKSL
jgi:3-oxoadipate enol-lactonase